MTSVVFLHRKDGSDLAGNCWDQKHIDIIDKLARQTPTTTTNIDTHDLSKILNILLSCKS